MLQYPRPSLRSARVVVGALLAGPLAFFGLASFLIGHFGGGMLPADAELTPGQAFWIWVAIAIGCFVPALMLRSRVVSRVEASRFVSDPVEASEALGEIQTYLVIAGALIEMPALLGGVFFLLYAASDFLWVGLAVLAVGAAVAFPRAEWFEPLERARDPWRAGGM